MQEVTAEGRRAGALRLFQDGKYEDASREFRAELDERQSSEGWNDWAAAETMCGRIETAIAGFLRALQLDVGNSEARENLLALRERCLQAIATAEGSKVDEPGAGTSETGGTGEQEQTPEEAFQSFLSGIRQIPLCDPGLSQSIQWAIARSGSDSSYYVREAYRLVGTLNEAARRQALQMMEQLAENNYRLWLVIALDAFERQDWPRVMHFLRKAGDRNPADLFVERVRMHTEEQWSQADAAHQNPFAGLDEYLRRSFCAIPWENVEVSSWGPEIEKTGDVYLCCPAQLPLPAGNIREQAMETVWNSEVAQEIRRAILDGNFRYCSRIHCPLIGGRQLPSREAALANRLAKIGGSNGALEHLYPVRLERGPEELHLSYDRSCNLSCPSCRDLVYVATKARQEEMELAYGEKLRKLAKEARIVYLDGAGEAFASKHSRGLMKSLTRAEYPQLRFQLISNGQLLDQRAWEDLDLWGRVDKICLSMDGASEETYRITRRGGTLARFLRNLAFLDGLRRSGREQFAMNLHFVVSALTFREMPEAVRLARKFHVDRLIFIAFRNWGHMGRTEVQRWMVTNPEHPLHEEFVSVLNDPELNDALVDLGTVMESRRSTNDAGAHS